jgi:hypothetical protein
MWIAPPAIWNAAQATSQQIPNVKNNTRKIESARNRIVESLNSNSSTPGANAWPAVNAVPLEAASAIKLVAPDRGLVERHRRPIYDNLARTAIHTIKRNNIAHEPVRMIFQMNLL